jgi:hypothetical protein
MAAWLLKISTAQPVSPDVVAMKNRKLRRAEMLWPRAGRIMMAERMWLNTQRMTAPRSLSLGRTTTWHMSGFFRCHKWLLIQCGVRSTMLSQTPSACPTCAI